MEEQKIFEEFKKEYSLPQTTESRKKELLKLMQDNLKQRCCKDSGFVKCMDGKEYSLNSDSASELFAIYGALKEAKDSEVRDEISETTRAEALSRNKYGPNNPYPKK